MTDAEHPHSFEELPQAAVEGNRKRWLFWLLPLAAAGLAGYFIYRDVFAGGPTLHIYFADAQGLEAGKSDVKYRGAHVGEVKALALAKDSRNVEVTIKLDRSAATVAREGSRFWIVKAELGVGQITAPRTIVSGDFITFEPGEGKPQTTFTGLAETPVIAPDGAVRIVLLAEKLGALKKRSPVFYRGVQVGQVDGCQLGPDSQDIRITVDIDKHYAPLVRPNSRFWNAGGVHVALSLAGAQISAQSAETLVSGGVDFATPDTTEKPARSGTPFRLYDKPEDAWLAWAPRIQLRNDDGKRNPEITQANK
jgi:paraquat-inducible protein B